ncbi:glycoside hydrolase family 88 protein [Intestinibacter bartlettii]|uniref:Glycoside hydrolase family 88 protein n=1 Tax=Intestinibacter bartlettii TaxID=261299 RepID=A0ABS6DZQ0_9FIRM|nr:glycoside hydrolase family 88 protein [Intestinibacter bartlettii]MBU5337318.1 glycoside hydrolase family 88 protein [Intestinibacter bartlettii]
MIKIIVFIFLILSIIIFGVDFYFYILNRYCRYHIGRWKNYDEWLNKIKNISIKWTKKTPVVKMTDNNRLMVIDMINGKYKNNNIQSWQVGGLLLGLCECNDKESKDAINKLIVKLIDKDGNWVTKPTNIDCGLLSYAILKNSKDYKKIKPAMDYSIEIIEKNMCEDGMVAYTSDKNVDERYVDTLGFICPFLQLYSNIYGEERFSKISLEQINQYNKYGLLYDTYLPNHAYNPNNKLPLGVYGWGRGVAWYVIGLIDTYIEMKDSDEKLILKQNIKNVADSYINYQREDGGFGSILQNERTYDSSATAVLAYFYSRCYEIFEIQRYLEVSNKCLQKIKSVTRITGKVDWCQGDTKAIGVHSQTFDIMPFAQGFTLRAALINLERK